MFTFHIINMYFRKDSTAPILVELHSGHRFVVELTVSVDYCRDGSFIVHHDGASYRVEASLDGDLWLTCRVDDVRSKVKVVSVGDSLSIFTRVSGAFLLALRFFWFRLILLSHS